MLPSRGKAGPQLHGVLERLNGIAPGTAVQGSPMEELVTVLEGCQDKVAGLRGLLQSIQPPGKRGERRTDQPLVGWSEPVKALLETRESPGRMVLTQPAVNVQQAKGAEVTSRVGVFRALKRGVGFVPSRLGEQLLTPQPVAEAPVVGGQRVHREPGVRQRIPSPERSHDLECELVRDRVPVPPGTRRAHGVECRSRSPPGEQPDASVPLGNGAHDLNQGRIGQVHREPGVRERIPFPE